MKRNSVFAVINLSLLAVSCSESAHPAESDDTATGACEWTEECHATAYITDSDELADILNCSLVGGLWIEETQLTQIELPCLKESPGTVWIEDNEFLESIYLPNLQVAKNVEIGDNPLLVQLDILALAETEELDISSNDALAEVDVPLLENADGDVRFIRNQELDQLSLPALRSVGGDIHVSYNDSLSSLDGLCSIETVAVELRIVDNCSLSQTAAEVFAESIDVGGEVEVSGNGGDCD